MKKKKQFFITNQDFKLGFLGGLKTERWLGEDEMKTEITVK